MKIYLKDFPNEIYVKLDKNYGENLFKKLNKFRLKYLNQKLGVSKTTIIEWKKRAEYISLGNLKKILNLLRESFEGLENKIISYGTKRSKYFIKNLKLPINDSTELREIVIHIMCDGCYSKENGYAAYYNFPKETKEEFVKELKKCFGEVDLIINEDHVHFPTAIPFILSEYFKIDFHSKRCRVPKEFLKGDRKKLSAIIRASIIDEGTVDGSNVRIDSCNKEFLEDLKKVCKQLDYKCGKIWVSKGPIFRFNILAETIKQLREDMKELPILKKQQLIDIVEKNQRRNWKYKLPGEVKKQILKALLEKPKRVIELILKLELLKTTIQNHLKWLKKKEIIDYKEGNKRTYFIKDKEKAKQFINNPSQFIKCKKIDNYGISQLKVLEILNKNNKKYSEIEKKFGFCKSATFKLISSLKNKGFIIKNNKGKWNITKKGKKILLLDKNTARYVLYANAKLA